MHLEVRRLYNGSKLLSCGISRWYQKETQTDMVNATIKKQNLNRIQEIRLFIGMHNTKYSVNHKRVLSFTRTEIFHRVIRFANKLHYQTSVVAN